MQHQMDSLPSFDPTREAAGKEFQTWALNSSPPKNTLPPKVIRPYLEQGCLAPLEPCSASPHRLASFESRASSLNVPTLEGSSSGLPLGSLVPSVSLGSRPPRVSPLTGLPSTINTIHDLPTPLLLNPPSARPSSDFLPSGQSTIGSGIESPEAFFTATLGRSEEKRVKRLVGVAKGFSKAKECPNRLDTTRWSSIFKSKLEEDSDAKSIPKTFEAGYTNRLLRLKQICQDIGKGDWEASRLWLICVYHEVEHISQWEGIDAYTSRGVDRRSAAANIVKKHLGKWGSNLLKRCGNIVHLMAEGGPAAVLLDNGNRPNSIWERTMTLDDITIFYGYKRNKLPHTQTKSHDPDAADEIKNCFLTYGWSSQELLRSKTKVMVILRFYKSEGPGDSESANKRRRVDQPGASTSYPDHNFPATSLDQFSPGSIDPATSSGIDNTVESMNRSNSSHLILFNARNGTRNLTDPAMMGNLNYAFNSSDGLDTINGPAADDLGYAADILQSLPNPDYETDASVNEALWWTVNGSDPSTHMFLQEAISATQLYLLNDFTYQSTSLPNASTPGCLDPQT